MNINKNILIMRTKSFIAIFILAVAFIFTSCENSAVDPTVDLGILPESFKVDVPGALSYTTTKSTGTKSTNDDFEGQDIYQLLGLFIHVGEESAQLVEDIIYAISVHGINKPMEISFVSDDDLRTKNLVVIDDAEFEGKLYDHAFTITDAESEENADGGKAMQVFWNSNPVDGIAIIKPFNINRETSGVLLETMYRIEYTNKVTTSYDETMKVMISGLPLTAASADPFSIETLQMFVGRKGDIVDVFGNSNHPNAYLIYNDDPGFNWAFVASGYNSKNIGVAEVGLPPSDLNTTSRREILEDYSIKQVFTDEINRYFIDNYSVQPDSAQLSTLLQETEAPGYFANGGFVQAGTMPDDNYIEIDSRIDNLTPFNPLEVSNLTLFFQ